MRSSPPSVYDVIVVGGGPAGSTAARRLALAGRRVVLLERSRFPRYKCCGGAVTERARALFDFDIAPAVERTVHRVILSYRGGQHHPVSTESQVAIDMVMRSAFDALLLNRAREVGVEVWEGEEAVDLTNGPDEVKVRTRTGMAIRGRVGLGADGASSRVARLAGHQPSGRVGAALSCEIRVPEKLFASLCDAVQLDFGGVAYGYRWSFPKASHFTIGVCGMRPDSINLKESLNDYISTNAYFKDCSVISSTSHPLPFYRPGRRYHSGRVILIGDAAGFVDPLTGEGILHAICSALLAAECVEDFFRDKAPLEAYAQRVESEIACDFSYAAKFAELFLGYPWVCYQAGVMSRTVKEGLIRVLMGQGTYEEAYHALKATKAGRLGSVILQPEPKESSMTDP